MLNWFVQHLVSNKRFPNLIKVFFPYKHIEICNNLTIHVSSGSEICNYLSAQAFWRTIHESNLNFQLKSNKDQIFEKKIWIYIENLIRIILSVFKLLCSWVVKINLGEWNLKLLIIRQMKLRV